MGAVRALLHVGRWTRGLLVAGVLAFTADAAMAANRIEGTVT